MKLLPVAGELEAQKCLVFLFSFFCLFSLLNFCSGSDAQGWRQMVPLQPAARGAPKTSPACHGEQGWSSGIAGLHPWQCQIIPPPPECPTGPFQHQPPQDVPWNSLSKKERSHPPWGRFYWHDAHNPVTFVRMALALFMCNPWNSFP